ASRGAQRPDPGRGRAPRRLAGNDPEVNEEWNCDKGRWAFTYATEPDRLITPLVRNESGVLAPASWPEALGVAAAGLAAARGRAGVLTAPPPPPPDPPPPPHIPPPPPGRHRLHPPGPPPP